MDRNRPVELLLVEGSPTHAQIIGQALSRRLAEPHGATLELASQPGAGTTVSVSFPAERMLDFSGM